MKRVKAISQRMFRRAQRRAIELQLLLQIQGDEALVRNDDRTSWRGFVEAVKFERFDRRGNAVYRVQMVCGRRAFRHSFLTTYLK